MIELELNLRGKLDKNGKEYYFVVTRAPTLVDLSNAVILIFPWDEAAEKGEPYKFGARMVVRHYDPDHDS